jgi:hypothetical protein
VPENTQVSVNGFHDPALGEQLARAVSGIVLELGRYIDLSRLDGVTVGVDYDAALSAIDRGMEGLRPLSRSNTAEMQGVAMSPAVVRDGSVKTHLVFDAAPLVALISAEANDDERAGSIGIIAHECAHVEVTAQKEEAIPEARLGTRIEGYERALYFPLAEVFWDEYAACRLSAAFSRPQLPSFAELTTSTSVSARETANAAIREYRLHGDLHRLLGEAGPPLFAPLKAVCYLLGTMDGLELTWADVPDVWPIVQANGYESLIADLHAVLLELWATQETWQPDLDTFNPLLNIASRTFESSGISIKSNPDGSGKIDVPFTVETMPGYDRDRQ